MAIQVKKAAAGDAPATGMMKTPPPVRPAPPDDISDVRNPHNVRSGLGMNGYSGASSLPPGQTRLSPLAENLRASSEGDEGLLDRIAQRGTGKNVIADVDLQSPQTRDVSKEPYPSAHGMHAPKSDGTIPSKLGGSPMADEMRRRADALRRI